MKNKRILSLIAAFAMTLTIAGCSAKNTENTASVPQTASEASAVPGTSLASAPETVSEASPVSGTSSAFASQTSADAPVTVSSSAADTTASLTSEPEKKAAGLRYVPGTGTLCEEPDTMVRRKANNVGQIVGTMYNGEALNPDFYYYRCMLNDNGKSAYDTIHAGLLTGANSIKLSTPLSVSDVDIVFYSVIYDDPVLVWVEPGYSYTYNNSGSVISISPVYNKLAKDIAGAKKALESSVSKALSVMWELPNNIERSKYAHDYLTHTIDYVESDLDQNAYSALVQHKTVCAGYSQAFAYMMQKMGAPCAVVIGYAGEDHAWNIVMLDGESYVTDVTWDDPYQNPPDTYYYDYFNITSAQMSRDHTLQSPSTYLAPATGTKASYSNYFRGNAYGTDFDSPDIISNTPAPVTSSSPVNTTTKPPVTAAFDWDSYWNDDWWSDYGIDTGWNTSTSAATTTQAPVTTTRPPVTTTKPPVTTAFDWDSYWNDDWWSDYGIDTDWNTSTSAATTTHAPVTTTRPPVTTTKPPATTTYNWDYDYGWDDDYGWDSNNWNWDYSDDYGSWGLDMSGYDYGYGYDYDYDYDDYSDYFDDYYYDIGTNSSSGWWSYLDPYWTKNDWTYDSDGLWFIEDPDTGYLYMYDETDDTFYCMDDRDNIYQYDSRTDDWIKI